MSKTSKHLNDVASSSLTLHLIFGMYRSFMNRLEIDILDDLKTRDYPPELLPHLGNRLKESIPCFSHIIPKYFRWLFDSRQHTNYAYDLTPLNKRHLAWLCHAVTGKPVAECTAYVKELDEDADLREHIRSEQKRMGSTQSDPDSGYGRRMLWYVLARITKPKIVVETGLDQGLGSVVLASALIRNRAEGHLGRYIGVDITPGTGWLLSGRYRDVGEIRVGDSIQVLTALREQVDFVVLDSSHTVGYETKELGILEPKISRGTILISDTGDHSDDLLNFAERTEREFLLFSEASNNHWYAGNANGIAFTRDS